MRWTTAILAATVAIGAFTISSCTKQSCIDTRLEAMDKLTTKYEELARAKDLDLIEVKKRSEELKSEAEAFSTKLEADRPDCASDTTTWSAEQLKKKDGYMQRLETAGRQIGLRLLKGN